jgi:uncharacterized protein
MKDYYVYAYIDPRNFEEFYYGKGKGSRKDAHLADISDSPKSKRIAEIRKDGLEPIIRVLVKDLSEPDALLVEKTLIWKLGKLTTNIATGSFAANFRPHDTYHKELSGFDFKNGIYYYNVGEGLHRNWDDYRNFSFISAGQGERWRDAMRSFKIGDIFAAYFKGKGYVGIGRITATAKMAVDVRIKGKSLLLHPLHCKGLADNSDDPDKAEFVCTVDWLKAVPRQEAKWRKSPKLFTSTHVRASLDGQPSTIDYLQEAFKIAIRDAAA